MWIQETFILNSLINVCFLIAIWRIRNQKREVFRDFHTSTLIKPSKDIQGKLDKMYIRSVIAEKMAERAFNLASTANLGVIALQKSLQIPRTLNKQQGLKNKLAKNDIDKLFSSSGTFDYLRPILSEEENELLDSLEQDKFKEEAL